MFKVLQLEELRQLSCEDQKKYIFDLALQIDLLINFQDISDLKDIFTSFDEKFTNSMNEEDDLIDELNQVFPSDENNSTPNFSVNTTSSFPVINSTPNFSVNTTPNFSVNATPSLNVNMNNSTPNFPIYINNSTSYFSLDNRCDSTLPHLHVSEKQNMVLQSSDTEFTKFLQDNPNINDHVIHHNSLNIRRLRKTSSQQSNGKNSHPEAMLVKRKSSLETRGKYGCKLCGQVHFLSNLEQRKSQEAHEPMLYMVRNFLLRYDIAPNVSWKESFMKGDNSYQLDMLERFFCIILPDHENDYLWSYLLRKRSYDTRNCKWSSNEGDLIELKKRNILDLFVKEYRELRPYEIRKSPKAERVIVSKVDARVDEILNRITSSTSPPPLTNSLNVTVASVMFYDSEESEKQDAKRKREI